MDLSVINHFREKVNNKGFTYFWYRTRSELNQWNCICSAMDWITVAVEHIASITPEKTKTMSSIDVFAYISSVDIIVESVQQLHRVINRTSEQLFKDDSDIFAGNQFGQNDIRYFKTLRSCFGAHPVNLDEPGAEQNREMRRFASWSSNTWGKGTSSVILYSNQQKEKNIFLSIDLQQVLHYGEKFYEYLKVLGHTLNKQYEKFAEEKCAEVIPYSKDPNEHLDILLKASEQRLDNPSYRSIIQELKLLFSTNVTDTANQKIVAAYLKNLLMLIDEIHEHLQNMDFTDLDYDDLLYPAPKAMPNGWGYWYEKISEYIYGTEYPPILWESQIRDLLNPYIKLAYDSYEELYLLVQAVLYDLKTREQ